MSWLNEWTKAGTAAKERAEATPCPRCGGEQTIGYSNMGIPLVACPACSPSLVANGKRAVEDVWL